MAEQTEQGQRHAPDLSVEYRNIDTLIPYVNNARTHSDEQVAQIAASIKEFGWTNPVLVDGDNGIIAGHGRVQAARKLGQTDIPVIELEGLSEAQRRAYILADNRLAENATWDTDLFPLEIQKLAELDFNLSLIGVSDFEINYMTNRGAEDDSSIEEFPEIDLEESTLEYKCPSCDYEWDGAPR